MSTHAVYSSKAEKYARYRWDYAPEAIGVLCELGAINPRTTVVDLGAGSGILTRHFAGKAGRVLAVEPNPEMRRLASGYLRGAAGCRILAAAAEELPLADHCVDWIVAAHALHWFRPAAALAEFERVLKAGGRLAVFSNRGADPALGAALHALNTAENGVEAPRAAPPGRDTPQSYYFSEYQSLSFPFTVRQNWQSFLGSLLSASFMPDEDHPRYPNLERAARLVFERFSSDGILETSGYTELNFGKIRARLESV